MEDRRTPAEIAYDNLKSGAAYASLDTPISPVEERALDILLKRNAEFARGLAAGRELGALLQADADDAAIAAWIERNLPADEPEPVPFGQLADGTPIMGEFNGVNGVYQRWGVVAVDTGEISIAADDAGFFAFNIGENDLEEVTIPQLHALRDLLNTGAFERLYAAAEAWGRGDDTPPFGAA